MTRGLADCFTGAVLGTVIGFPGGASRPAPMPAKPKRQPPQPLALRRRVTARPPYDFPGEGEIRAVVRRPGGALYDVQTDDGRYLENLPARCVEPLED